MSDRQPFYDYVASEAQKSRRQALPKRSATITTESQRVGLLPPAAQQSTSSSYSVFYTPSPIGFGNPPSVNLQVADEESRHNLSGILSQLPDPSSQFIDQQQHPQQQRFIAPAPPQQQQLPQLPVSLRGWPAISPFQGN